jgi:hypothetical protein
MLPAADREAFAFDLVRFQIEELNGLGDRLRYIAEQGQVEEHRVGLRRRCDEIAEALRWDADEVVRLTWKWLEAPIHHPEDAFGPHFLLTHLRSDEKRHQAWLASLSGETSDMLRILD